MSSRQAKARFIQRKRSLALEDIDSQIGAALSPLENFLADCVNLALPRRSNCVQALSQSFIPGAGLGLLCCVASKGGLFIALTSVHRPEWSSLNSMYIWVFDDPGCTSRKYFTSDLTVDLSLAKKIRTRSLCPTGAGTPF